MGVAYREGGASFRGQRPPQKAPRNLSGASSEAEASPEGSEAFEQALLEGRGLPRRRGFFSRAEASPKAPR
eukprot:8234218-Pyramimonas_sp.AAC.1